MERITRIRERLRAEEQMCFSIQCSEQALSDWFYRFCRAGMDLRR